MIAECLHCHATVLFLEDNRCPSCRKNSRDSTGATPHLTRITLREYQAVVGRCIGCGEVTSGTEQLGRSRTMGGESLGAKVALVLLGFVKPSLWFKLLSPEVAGNAQSVQVTFGRCERCAASGPVQEVRVDFNERVVTLLAHRRFAELIAPLLR